MPLVRLGLFACLTAGLGAQESPAWSFRGEAQPDLQASGGVTFVQPGPRRPDYPTFDLKNQAARFDGKGARLMLADSPDHRFDFTNGDAITLEAWVKLDGLRKGSNVYLIGKGRTKAGSSNQNWALTPPRDVRLRLPEFSLRRRPRPRATKGMTVGTAGPPSAASSTTGAGTTSR